MKLGGSMRRRRGSGGGGKAKRAGSTTKRRRRKSAPASPGGRGRLLLTAAGLALLGWAGGYLVATQVVFRAPAAPTDLVEVPDLRGQGLATVVERLEAAGLVLGSVDSLRHPSVPRDLVMGQSPLPGQLTLPGGEVSVTTSLGAQTRPVPDVVRLDAEGARVILETAGFVVGVDSVASEVPRGRVVATLPPAESPVALPARITLRVSRGPPLIPMPLLLGMEENAAMAVLDSLGLVVAEVEEIFRFGRDQGLVVEQEPAAETLVERGGAVRLAVGRRGG